MIAHTTCMIAATRWLGTRERRYLSVEIGIIDQKTRPTWRRRWPLTISNDVLMRMRNCSQPRWSCMTCDRPPPHAPTLITKFFFSSNYNLKFDALCTKYLRTPHRRVGATVFEFRRQEVEAAFEPFMCPPFDICDLCITKESVRNRD